MEIHKVQENPDPSTNEDINKHSSLKSQDFSILSEVRSMIAEGAGSRISFVEMKENNEHLRVTLSGSYLKTRCGKLAEHYQFLDLTGRIVEIRLRRRICDDDLSTICSFLQDNPSVIYLNLSYNGITSVGFSYLAHFLAQYENLKTLNLMQNDITEINEAVLRKTASLWSLRCLILTGNKFGKSGGITIANMLQYNTSVSHLDLGETDQNIQSVSYIIDALIPYIHGNTCVTKLDLSRIIPSPYKDLDSSQICQLLSTILLHNQFLVEIHLSKNCITDLDLEIIVDALRKNKVLELLNLSGNRLSCYGLELLASILPETCIKQLMFGSNRIGDGGAIALGRVFSKTNLSFLDISNNKIKDAGFLNLIWGMKAKHPPVHTFFFFGNPISMETAEIVHRQVFLGHISPVALDVEFVWKKNKLTLVEDRTANRFRNLHYFVYEPGAQKRPLHHTCCYETNQRTSSGKVIQLPPLSFDKYFAKLL